MPCDAHRRINVGMAGGLLGVGGRLWGGGEQGHADSAVLKPEHPGWCVPGSCYELSVWRVIWSKLPERIIVSILTLVCVSGVQTLPVVNSWKPDLAHRSWTNG